MSDKVIEKAAEPESVKPAAPDAPPATPPPNQTPATPAPNLPPPTPELGESVDNVGDNEELEASEAAGPSEFSDAELAAETPPLNGHPMPEEDDAAEDAEDAEEGMEETPEEDDEGDEGDEGDEDELEQEEQTGMWRASETPPMPPPEEDRFDLEQEIARLRDENTVLKSKLEEMIAPPQNFRTWLGNVMEVARDAVSLLYHVVKRDRP